MKYVDNKIVYEVGDWVFYIGERANDGRNNDCSVLENKAYQVTNRRGDVIIILGNENPGVNETYAQPNYVRPATQEEITKAIASQKPKFKIGDWVVVTKRHQSNQAYEGMVGQLSNITLGSSIPYCIGPIDSWCVDVRHATPAEIKRATEIKVGNHLVSFDYAKTSEYIKVGCERVDKDLFLKIGKKAGWI